MTPSVQTCGAHGSQRTRPGAKGQVGWGRGGHACPSVCLRFLQPRAHPHNSSSGQWAGFCWAL